MDLNSDQPKFRPVQLVKSEEPRISAVKKNTKVPWRCPPPKSQKSSAMKLSVTGMGKPLKQLTWLNEKNDVISLILEVLSKLKSQAAETN